ncbi:MAG: hypothetical protein IJI14_00460 [Anaerolineaceae bacterium]|nr:hypothetical protein [Anaerolineaceae bacterium]
MNKNSKLQFLKDFIINKNFVTGVLLLAFVVLIAGMALLRNYPENAFLEAVCITAAIVLAIPVAAVVITIIVMPFGLAYENALDRQKARNAGCAAETAHDTASETNSAASGPTSDHPGPAQASMPGNPVLFSEKGETA